MSVILDTNILVAGLYSRRGASYQLIKAAISGDLLIAISPLIALEYEGVLNRKIDEGFLQISKDNCNQILNAIFNQAAIVWKPIQMGAVFPVSRFVRLISSVKSISWEFHWFCTFQERILIKQLRLPSCFIVNI